MLQALIPFIDDLRKAGGLPRRLARSATAFRFPKINPSFQAADFSESHFPKNRANTGGKCFRLAINNHLFIPTINQFRNGASAVGFDHEFNMSSWRMDGVCQVIFFVFIFTAHVDQGTELFAKRFSNVEKSIPQRDLCVSRTISATVFPYPPPVFCLANMEVIIGDTVVLFKF